MRNNNLYSSNDMAGSDAGVSCSCVDSDCHAQAASHSTAADPVLSTNSIFTGSHQHDHLLAQIYRDVVNGKREDKLFPEIEGGTDEHWCDINILHYVPANFACM